jgi:O-antigen ligase
MTPVLLGIYIAIILIRPMDWWAPLLGIELLTVMAVVTFFTGFPAVLGRFQLVWQRAPQVKLAVAFLLAAMLSWAARFWFAGAQTAFTDVGKVIFFFLLILLLTKDRRACYVLLWTFLLCIAWMAIHAILQQHTGAGFGNQEPRYHGRNPETGAYIRRAVAFGTFHDPNDLCLILVVGIPLFFAQYQIASNPIRKAIALTGAALCLFGAWATNSRGGVVAIFGMLTAYSLTRIKGIKRYLLAAVAISLVTILAPTRFAGGLKGKDRSTLWGEGLAYFKSNPLFGIGYNDFTTYSTDHLVAHNTYIHTLAELGLVGYLPLFLMLYLTMIQLRRLIRLKEHVSTQDHLLLCSIFSALVGYLTGIYFISRQYQHILYVLLAIAITTTHMICNQYNLYQHLRNSLRTDTIYGLFWGLASVIVIWFTVRAANALS